MSDEQFLTKDFLTLVYTPGAVSKETRDRILNLCLLLEPKVMAEMLRVGPFRGPLITLVIPLAGRWDFSTRDSDVVFNGLFEEEGVDAMGLLEALGHNPTLTVSQWAICVDWVAGASSTRAEYIIESLLGLFYEHKVKDFAALPGLVLEDRARRRHGLDLRHTIGVLFSYGKDIFKDPAVQASLRGAPDEQRSMVDGRGSRMVGRRGE